MTCRTCCGHGYLLTAPSTCSAGGDRVACPVYKPTASLSPTHTVSNMGVGSFRAYSAGPLNDEPVEADFLSAHSTLGEAQSAVDNARKGGGWVWHPADRRLWRCAGRKTLAGPNEWEEMDAERLGFRKAADGGAAADGVLGSILPTARSEVGSAEPAGTLSDEDRVEIVAKAMWDASSLQSWDDDDQRPGACRITPHDRQVYRDHARAAIAALTADKPDTQGLREARTIPSDMKPWDHESPGYPHPPTDYDGGKVFTACGELEDGDTLLQDLDDTGSNQWHHRNPGGVGCDIIAYTPARTVLNQESR